MGSPETQHKTMLSTEINVLRAFKTILDERLEELQETEASAVEQGTINSASVAVCRAEALVGQALRVVGGNAGGAWDEFARSARVGRIATLRKSSTAAI